MRIAGVWGMQWYIKSPVHAVIKTWYNPVDEESDRFVSVWVQDEEQYAKLPEPSDEENDMLDLAFGLTET